MKFRLKNSVKIKTGEMTQQLREHTALAEDKRLASSCQGCELPNCSTKAANQHHLSALHGSSLEDLKTKTGTKTKLFFTCHEGYASMFVHAPMQRSEGSKGFPSLSFSTHSFNLGSLLSELGYKLASISNPVSHVWSWVTGTWWAPGLLHGAGI